MSKAGFIPRKPVRLISTGSSTLISRSHYQDILSFALVHICDSFPSFENKMGPPVSEGVVGAYSEHQLSAPVTSELSSSEAVPTSPAAGPYQAITPEEDIGVSEPLHLLLHQSRSRYHIC